MRKRVRSHSFRQPILNPKVYQTARRKHPEKKERPFASCRENEGSGAKRDRTSNIAYSYLENLNFDSL